MVRRGGTVNFFGGCPSDSRVIAGHLAAALLRDHLQGQLPPHAGATSEGARPGPPQVITAQDFVNREEPLANLLEVMRHLMSHNGHLKTAIIPVSAACSCRPTISSSRPEALAARLYRDGRSRLHALAGHPPLREFPRGQLPAAPAAAPGFLQRLRLLPLGRRSGRRNRRHGGKPAAARLVARRTRCDVRGQRRRIRCSWRCRTRRRGTTFPSSRSPI